MVNQTITQLPTPPSTTDIVNFNDRADNFLAAIPTFVTQTNTVIEQINSTETNINSKESSATNAAGTATTQAGIATTKANEASSSATAAYNAQLAAEAVFDNFDDKYLGAKATAPTVDNDGNPLVTGALYFRTTAPKGIYVYDDELSAWSIFSYIPTSHGTLSGRSDANSHPMSAITGLISAIEGTKGAAIASAATTSIGTVGLGDYIHITGTTAITSLGTASSAGVRRTLIFDSAGCVLTHSANIICPGAVSITSVANTVIEVVAETTSIWRVVSVTHPNISHAELGYLDGVTSNIQTQFSNLASANNASVMSALNANGSAPIYACRAWVNFNGTGTVAIRGSGNVSSITDNGTGDYSINFTTAMPDANYSASIDGRMSSGFPVNGMVSSTIPTAYVVRVYTYRGDNSPGLADTDYVLVNIFR